MTDAAEMAISRADAAEKRAEMQKRNTTRKRQLLARLSRDKDFETFLRTMLEDLCAFDFGERELSPFTQGIRAAASHMMNFVASTKEGAEIISRLATEHFKAGAKSATAKTAINEETEA